MIESYWRDVESLSDEGYAPTSQVYIEGSWGALDIILAIVTIPLIVGVFLTVRLLVNRPKGSLVVTYTRQD
jgi:hypothetical protein